MILSQRGIQERDRTPPISIWCGEKHARWYWYWAHGQGMADRAQSASHSSKLRAKITAEVILRFAHS
jgi:hypothetical protein